MNKLEQYWDIRLDEKVRQVGYAPTISALFGINLTTRKSLIVGAVTGGVDGLIGSVLGIKAFAIGSGICVSSLSL